MLIFFFTERVLFEEGLGEDSEFSGYHPWVNLIYFILAIGITMFSLSPWFLAATLIASWTYSFVLMGKKCVKMNLVVTLWAMIIFSLINVLFVHNGETVLFFLNGNRITLEAFLYGFSVALMFTSMVIWFRTFNVIMTAEKLIFIFGKAAPVLGLTLSMIFRYIPLLQQRFKEIRMGQECLGRNMKKSRGIVKRVRQFGKEISILISWSLESSIEGADSMEARGYGLKGRTSFHLYRFTSRDAAFLLVLAVFAAGALFGLAHGRNTSVFYPKYYAGDFDMVTVISLASYLMMLLVPAAMDIYGEIRWDRSGARAASSEDPNAV